MATRTKRHSMAEALKQSDDVRAFLEEGRPEKKCGINRRATEETAQATEPRIAVTARLPKTLAHALIDASAERRKNREKAWSQQDIVAEALEDWFSKK